MSDALKLKVEMPNLKQIIMQLGQLNQHQLQALGTSLFQEYELVMTASKQQVPVDLGTLRSSAHVQLPKFSNEYVEVEGGYGGPAGAGNQGETNDEAVGYAVYQHENLEYKHTEGQKAKYLEDPLMEAIPTIQNSAINALTKATKETMGA
jgi:hypothetical protein